MEFGHFTLMDNPPAYGARRRDPNRFFHEVMREAVFAEEIGLNSTALEYGDDIILVDAGLMFPEEDMLGVDFVIPDFSYILENRERVRGIVITHGHEDHTGALPFLFRELISERNRQTGDPRKDFEIPVYGTPLTLGFIKEKIEEHRLDQVRLVPVKPRDVIELGAFSVEFVRVTHSIVDGVGLCISTPLGRIVHTGGFKIDPTPVDGQLMDFHRFAEFGEKGTLVMLSDSTNAEKGGFTFSEKEVRRAFEDIFSKAKGRIIIATFASNIHRIQQAIDVAAMFGRKVILCGKSMVSNSQIALDLGFVMPLVRTRDDAALSPSTYRILLHGVEVASGRAPADLVLALPAGDGSELRGIAVEETTEGSAR